MLKALAPAILALWVSAMAVGPALAGCACACVDGNIVAACSSDLDIPPICPLRTCTQPTVRPPVGIISRRSCVDTQVCDKYGNCRWDTVCQ